MPAFIVIVDAGQLPQAPTSSTVTLPVASSTSWTTMSPPSAWSAGRMTSIVSSTWAITQPMYLAAAAVPSPACKDDAR